mmetsp:Transcript_16058/g.45713  ORF Transcript_16058/g.45713 Transcript_16058/m.45713 type:complete len:519 (+) Transcript_16058:528-2084(+)
MMGTKIGILTSRVQDRDTHRCITAEALLTPTPCMTDTLKPDTHVADFIKPLHSARIAADQHATQHKQRAPPTHSNTSIRSIALACGTSSRARPLTRRQSTRRQRFGEVDGQRSEGVRLDGGEGAPHHLIHFNDVSREVTAVRQKVVNRIPLPAGESWWCDVFGDPLMAAEDGGRRSGRPRIRQPEVAICHHDLAGCPAGPLHSPVPPGYIHPLSVLRWVDLCGLREAAAERKEEVASGRLVGFRVARLVEGAVEEDAELVVVVLDGEQQTASRPHLAHEVIKAVTITCRPVEQLETRILGGPSQPLPQMAYVWPLDERGRVRNAKTHLVDVLVDVSEIVGVVEVALMFFTQQELDRCHNAQCGDLLRIRLHRRKIVANEAVQPLDEHIDIGRHGSQPRTLCRTNRSCRQPSRCPSVVSEDAVDPRVGVAAEDGAVGWDGLAGETQLMQRSGRLNGRVEFVDLSDYAVPAAVQLAQVLHGTVVPCLCCLWDEACPDAVRSPPHTLPRHGLRAVRVRRRV